jgi:transcriptional regulator with XRE-family HTH domain
MAYQAFDAGPGTGCPAYNAQLHPAVAEKLYALGLTQSVIAEAFGVSLQEISDWERDYKEFYAACERGRSAAPQVEQASRRLATGYVENGERLRKVHGELVIAPYRRQVPPSVAAIRLLTKGKTPRDVSGDHVRKFFNSLKPRTIFDAVAEDDKKRKKWKPFR